MKQRAVRDGQRERDEVVVKGHVFRAALAEH